MADRIAHVGKRAVLSVAEMRFGTGQQKGRRGNEMKAMYILNADTYDWIYGPSERAEIAGLVEVIPPLQTSQTIRDHWSLLADVDLILSGWGGPLMDAAFLSAAPKLRAVFYGAGATAYITPDAFWERDIVLTSAIVANSQPVVEYTLGVILLSLKQFWRLGAYAKAGGDWLDSRRHRLAGAYGSTVGLIALGTVGRMLAERLRTFDVRVIACDPYVTDAECVALGVQRCELDEVFRRADVVSLHAPHTKDTEGLVTGRHLASMKTGATFINTARGAIVDEPELVDVLRRRSDLTAVLDVVHPEPPPPDAPVLRLPNVMVTPHIAGSLGPECRRMGRYMVEELQRYLSGQPLRWQVRREIAACHA